MIASILTAFGVACIIAGCVVERRETVDDVEEGVKSPAAIFADLPDNYDWAGQKIHDLDGD